MIRHFFTAQFLKFVFVGVVAASANWGARFILGFELSFPIAVTLAYVVGMTVAYILNRVLVFPMSDRPIVKQASEFVVVNLAFFPIVWLSSIIFREWLLQLGFHNYSAGTAHALALGIPMMATFLIYKFKTFRVQ